MCYLHETTTKMKACYKHMILLTIKAHLTGKVLWNFESNYQQKLEQVETKNKKFCRHDLTEVVIFFAEQEQAPFCNRGAIPLRSAFPQKLLQTCWIVLRLLTMFAPNFFGLSRCWGFEQRRSVGWKELPQSYF